MAKSDYSSLVMLGAVGVGIYFLYEWLQGTYCPANPTSSLCSMFATSASAATTAANPIAACQQAGGTWDTSGIVSQCVMPGTSTPAPSSAQAPSATVPASSATPPPTYVAPARGTIVPIKAPVYMVSLAQQLTAAMQNATGSQTGNVSQWNYVLTNTVQPGAAIITAATPYGDSAITADQYLNLFSALGVTPPVGAGGNATTITGVIAHR